MSEKTQRSPIPLLEQFLDISNLNPTKISIWNLFRVFICFIAIVVIYSDFFKTQLFKSIGLSSADIFGNGSPAWTTKSSLYILIGAFREELSHRLFISRNKLAIVGGGGFFIYFMLFWKLINLTFLDYLLIALIVAAITKIVYSSKVKESDVLVLLLLSILSFTFIHSSNLGRITKYFDGFEYYFMFVVLLLPQFLGGILYGLARIKFGFLSCILLHFCWNLFFSIASEYRLFSFSLSCLGIAIFIHQLHLIFMRYKPSFRTHPKSLK
jgi:hypothetical protein